MRVVVVMEYNPIAPKETNHAICVMRLVVQCDYVEFMHDDDGAALTNECTKDKWLPCEPELFPADCYSKCVSTVM
jgi:hypothetical protein